MIEIQKKSYKIESSNFWTFTKLLIFRIFYEILLTFYWFFWNFIGNIFCRTKKINLQTENNCLLKWKKVINLKNILAGSSAGGIGVINNIDTIALQAWKKNLKVKVRGIVDSSIFLLKNSEQAGELDLGLDYWKATTNPKCLTRTNSATECTTGHQSLHISSIKI